MSGGSRVGVDATTWVNPRGFGRFARNAVSRLVQLDPERSYVLFIDPGDAREAVLPEGAEQYTVRLRRRPSEAATASSNRPLRDLARLTATVARAQLDAFLFPSIYTYFPVVGPPTVIGLHDTTAEEFPELTTPGWRARTFWQLKQRLALRNASRLFTVSRAAQKAICSRFGIPVDLLPVVGEAPDPVFSPRPEETRTPVLERIGLGPREPFLLYVGGINPHKNLDSLLDGYARVRRDGPAPRLAVVGHLESDPYVSAAASLRERMAKLGLGDNVMLLGFVTDEELACLYSAATAVVIPSLAEGFGLPAVEAAACGAPVVLSDVPAHRETLGGAALFFPPRDAIALAGELQRLLGDEVLRRDLARQARKAVAKLSWDSVAEHLRDLIAPLAKEVETRG
jgi:glycosyltransferase involved in cell wall biosynthesis